MTHRTPRKTRKALALTKSRNVFIIEDEYRYRYRYIDGESSRAQDRTKQVGGGEGDFF